MNTSTRRLTALGLGLLGMSQWQAAQALPSFARQTGMDCDACHVGAFGPQLTGRGMAFKLDGYVDTDGKAGHVPLSAMLVANYTHESTDLPADQVPEHFDDNNNLAMQEISGFLAGRLTNNIGSFSQWTWSGIDRKPTLDNVDLRVVGKSTQGATLGLSLNNSPGVQDPTNNLSVWRFPYTSSELALKPSTTTMLDGGLSGEVYGANAYLAAADGLYAEIGLYHSFSKGQLDTFNITPGREITGGAPYARLAWLTGDSHQTYTVGLVGMRAKLGDYDSRSRDDIYSDYGIDGSAQFTPGRQHTFAINASYLHEHQRLRGTFDTGGSTNSENNLNQVEVAGSYYYARTWGITARYFDLYGTRDTARYAVFDNSATPLTNGSPDSTGYTLQVDFSPYGKEGSWNAPWANLRVGLQYTGYMRLNGATRNYDGAGRDASDDDNITLFLWTTI